MLRMGSAQGVRSGASLFTRSLAVAFLTLAAGCSASAEDPPYLFGASEMRHASEGHWVGTLKGASSETPVDLELVYAPSTQAACGSRTLEHGALTTACAGPTSSMGYTGTISTGDKRFEKAPLTANFMVFGSTLSDGELWVTVTGEKASGTLPFRSGGFSEGSFTLGGEAFTITVTRP